MITLNASGGSVTFTFSGNSTYLNDGTITVPKNSLALIVDESDMATFRKAASNDIFVSANIAEFGMTKAELESWYKANMVGSTGGGTSGGTTPEEVQGMIDSSLTSYYDKATSDGRFQPKGSYATSGDIESAVSGLAESSAVTLEINAAVSGKADSNSLATVATSGSYDDLLNKPTIPTVPTNVSAFNNDAGYLTEHQSLSAYSTTQEMNATINNATSGMATQQWVSGFTYDKETIDEKVAQGGTFDPTQYYTTANTYNKTEVDTKISEATSGKLDTSVFNTYSGNVATALDGKVDDAEISDMATKTWVGNQGYLTQHQDISGKLDVSAFTAYSGTVDTTINSKASESDLNTLSGTVTAHTADTTIHVTSSDKETWNAKSDFSGSYNDLTDKPTIPTVPTSNTAFTNDAQYATSGYVNSVVSGKVDSSSVVTSVTSASTDNEIPTAKAVFDAIPTGGGGGMTEDMERLISTALVDLNDRKIDASEVKSNYQKKGDYATKSALDLKANASEVMTLDKSKENELITATALNSINERLIALEAALQALHNNE